MHCIHVALAQLHHTNWNMVGQAYYFAPPENCKH